jgi:hypothetical protein
MPLACQAHEEMPGARRRNPITLRASIVLACTLLSVCAAIVAVGQRTSDVASLAELTAARLGLAPPEIERIRPSSTRSS